MEKKSKCCGEEMRWVDEFLCCARCGKETIPQPTEESLRNMRERATDFLGRINVHDHIPGILMIIEKETEIALRKQRVDFKNLLLSHSDIPEKTLAEIIRKLG